MKKSLLATILTAFFFVLSFVVTAQTNSPGANDGKGDTPSGPGGAPTPGDPSMGGGAPIGGGTLILIALGAAYGGKKVYKIVKDNLEELEN
jgi:hypothetical protein